MSHSTLTQARRKRTPKDFPLCRHRRGYWYKTFRKRYFYFEKIEDDPDGSISLKRWNHDKEYIFAGEEPPEFGEPASTTVLDICDHWLDHKLTLVKCGDLEQKTFDEYKDSAGQLIKIVGGKSLPAKACGPRQFEKVRVALAKKYNANGQAKRITQIRSIFNIAYEDQVIEDPPNFGRTFRKPKASAFRKLRNEKGNQQFTQHEVWTLIKHANINMKAMILLGLQCGMGNEDCAALPRSAIKDGWLEWARVKNAIPRRVPLWPETLDAIEVCISHASFKGEEELCFISARGNNYISPRLNGNVVAGDYKATVNRAKRDSGLETDRTFYDLRRTFETIAGETADQAAVDAVMGHTPSESNMAARYRQGISEERLQAVVNKVRDWLGEDQS